MTRIASIDLKNIETDISFGSVLERFKKFKGRARMTAWGDEEHIYLITHSELCANMRYGYGEYPGEPAFSTTLCRLHKDGRLEVGWRPDCSEMLSGQWSFINCGERDDIYSQSRNAQKARESHTN